MSKTRWAVLGPGDISGYFARALPRSQYGVLHAVGSASSPERAAAFAHRYGASISGTPDEILARDDIDAVYIGTVHTLHAELAIAALTAGKAVLCEKPVTPTPEATALVLAAAARSGKPFLEAFKYRFGPWAQHLQSLVQSGAIGRVQRLEAWFGFANTERIGRLFDPALAGGAILDVGGYPVSLAVAVAAWIGADIGAPTVSAVEGIIGETGVDEYAVADVGFGDFTARVGTAITRELSSTATLRGTEGTISLPNVWATREESGPLIVVQRDGEPERRVDLTKIDPFAAEADAVSIALAEGRQQVPEMPWAQSTSVARVLEDWRRALD